MLHARYYMVVKALDLSKSSCCTQFLSQEPWTHACASSRVKTPDLPGALTLLGVQMNFLLSQDSTVILPCNFQYCLLFPQSFPTSPRYWQKTKLHPKHGMCMAAISSTTLEIAHTYWTKAHLQQANDWRHSPCGNQASGLLRR